MKLGYFTWLFKSAGISLFMLHEFQVNKVLFVRLILMNSIENYMESLQSGAV